jgi:hypothetical protein
MLGALTASAVGKIVAVQEQCFRLVTDEGRVLLLRLRESRDTHIEDVFRYRDERKRVEVEYTGEPANASAVAESVHPL